MSATEVFQNDHWYAETHGDPNEWPYPDEFYSYSVVGELADRIKKAIACDDPNVDVTLVERVVSGGYSVHTQVNDYFFTISVGTFEQTFESQYGYSSIAELTDWLDSVDAN